MKIVAFVKKYWLEGLIVLGLIWIMAQFAKSAGTSAGEGIGEGASAAGSGIGTGAEYIGAGAGLGILGWFIIPLFF